ncbi:MAG: HAD-IC family P-type ATPase [bacterium]
MEFYKNSYQEVSKELNTDLEKGLTKNESEKRFKLYGQNSLPTKKPTSPFIIFIKQFLNPLMFILLIAAMLSIILQEFTDAIVIAMAAMLNVVVGFIQEFKAERALLAIQTYESTFCQVLRDNKITNINAKQLVPGDIVLISAGNKIPADVRLFNIIDFKVDESILTGESKPVSKQTEKIDTKEIISNQKNMAFAGTYAISGKAKGIITTTGINTHLGHIATLVTQTKTESTPLQNKIKKLSWILGGVMVGITIIISIVGLLKGMPFHEIILISIALAVAAIPEGLLVAVTVTLAIGMQRMLKRNALVRHLVAAETLGSVSVICTDKTGTITEGKMSVTQIATNSEIINVRELTKNEKLPEGLENILITATLNNDAQLPDDSKTIIGNPTEIAILQTAQNLGLNIKKVREKFERLNEIPFSSEIKFMATVHKINNENKLIVKGAPEKIFSFCKPDHNLKRFKEIADKMAMQGLRILAIAEKNINDIQITQNLRNLNCISLIGIKDPLRPQARKTLDELKNAGIQVIVITGDHIDTAINIAKEAGIDAQEKSILTGIELDEISDNQLIKKIKDINIFARVEPKHKIKIINALKKIGLAVAMIGDGVNDAPALKAADIGVALGSGSDVAHEISDVVLLDNNLSSIDAAVRIGRTIFDNIRKIIVYLLADSFSEIILIGVSILMGLPLPLLAAQIFWINLVTDGFPSLALTMEPSEPEVMEEKPRAKDEPIINTEMKVLIFLIGIITDLILLGLYIYLLKTGRDLTHIRTLIFTALAIDSLFYVFSVKSFRRSIFRTNIFSNKWLILAVFAGLITQLCAIYLAPLQKLFKTVPLTLNEWLIILSLGIFEIVAIEITKEWFILKEKNNSKKN